MPHTATAADRPADRRRDRRIDAPMTVVIGNTPYAIGDWSPAGARIVDYAGPLLPGDLAHLRVLVPTAGPGAMFRTEGRVRRVDPQVGARGLQFGSGSEEHKSETQVTNAH